MRINKTRFISILVVLVLVLSLGFILNILDLSLVLLTFILVGSCVKQKSNLHMMFFIGYCTFIFLPALLNWYYLEIKFELFFITSFVASIFLLLTRKTTIKEFIDYGNLNRAIFTLITIFLLLLVLIGYPGFAGAMFPFIIIMLSMSFKQDNLKNNLFFLLIFIIYFAVYIIWGWTGFGRTVVMSWLFLALLQFSYSISFKINKYLFGIIPGLFATLLTSRDLLNLQFSGFEDALYDSAYGPYRLASSFINEFNIQGYDFLGFWDQILFTFLVFIPRDVWPSKPYGFGFEYTVRHYDISYIEAGHSIAATLIGEHIYYLGYFGIVTALIVLYIIAKVSNLLYNIRDFNGNAIIIFSASMMALVWGGMTSFSARVIYPTIIFISLFYVYKKVLTKKYKLIWRV